MEKIFMAHGIPHNRVRNQAIHVTYNPYKRLTYIVGIIGFLGIAGLTGAEWILDRISYAVEQNTQPLQDEERKTEETAIRYRVETAYDTPWMQRARQEVGPFGFIP